MKTQTYQSIISEPTPPRRTLRGSSPKLHAKSAAFSPKLHSYLHTLPRILRGFVLPHFFTMQYQRFHIQNIGAYPLTPSPLNPLIPSYCIAAFTLIELMAATTVLSVVLLMMVGMQDQMSKAWSNANRRTDATREARAAARRMASDLASMSYRPDRPNSSYDSFAAVLSNQGLPYLYSSNGSSTLLTIPNKQAGSSYLFAICNQASRGSNFTDIGLVGYYIASSASTNVNGFAVTNYNLHRYYVPASNAVSNLTSWFSSRSAAGLFAGVNPATDDILARNTCNLRITFFGRAVPDGLNYSNTMSSSGSYRGNKMQVEWTTYPDDVAQKIPITSWARSTNVQKFGRSFEFRLDLKRN